MSNQLFSCLTHNNFYDYIYIIQGSRITQTYQFSYFGLGHLTTTRNFIIFVLKKNISKKYARQQTFISISFAYGLLYAKQLSKIHEKSLIVITNCNIGTLQFQIIVKVAISILERYISKNLIVKDLINVQYISKLRFLLHFYALIFEIFEIF